MIMDSEKKLRKFRPSERVGENPDRSDFNGLPVNHGGLVIGSIKVKVRHCEITLS